MKKSLLALAVLAASGVAMAQSSVTLYGVADVSVAKTTDKSLAASANGLLNNGNSRFGMRGVEDLGGGLKASFNMEAAVNLANGATDSNMFQRAAYMALDGSFGQIYAGRRLSPSFYAIANYELTGTANYSAIGNKFGFGGTRNDAFIAYSTPAMSGFKATVGTTLKGNNAPTQGAKTEMALTYNQGPLSAGISYNSTAQNVGAAKKNGQVGAAYDFGDFKLAASYQDPTGAKKGFTIGGTAKLGTTALTLDLARDTGSAYKSTDYVFEALQPLSKRTFVYGVLYHAGKTSAAAKDINTFGVGVRHNF